MFTRFLDTTISLLIKGMFAAFAIGVTLIVVSEFYEPALGKWSIFTAAPYVLIIPVYLMKLILRIYERLTRRLLKNK